MSSTQPPSLTVGIPTCYGGASLVHAIKSIRASIDVGKFSIVVVADSRPISPTHKQQLHKLGVALIENSQPASQMKKIKQIIALCTTDVLVITQDDIRFAPNLLKKIIATFQKDQKVTMVVAKVEPEKATTHFERILAVGVGIVYGIAKKWHGGDNYLAANGRVTAFRTAALKKFILPEVIVNGDGYLYFENKRQGGGFQLLVDGIVYNRSPLTLTEHTRQTSRFQYSQAELSRYFTDLASQYAAPRTIVFEAVVEEFLQHPILFLEYVVVFGYSRLKHLFSTSYTNATWSAEPSTKRV